MCKLFEIIDMKFMKSKCKIHGEMYMFASREGALLIGRGELLTAWRDIN